MVKILNLFQSISSLSLIKWLGVNLPCLYLLKYYKNKNDENMLK